MSLFTSGKITSAPAAPPTRTFSHPTMVEQAIRGWRNPMVEFATVPINRSRGPSPARDLDDGPDGYLDEDALMNAPHIYFSDVFSLQAAQAGGNVDKHGFNVE